MGMIRNRTPAFVTLALASLIAATPSAGTTPVGTAGPSAPGSTGAPQDDGPAKETQLPRDHKQLDVIDGELTTAGIVDERSARIAEALRTQDYETAETLLVEA